mmetsp:Transcript_2812/g.11080  ORF Transcript_2812/g.11080 Transcript_2812/m.11080 type:complete len:214 (+) Transcript_2812:1422-2063(+)
MCEELRSDHEGIGLQQGLEQRFTEYLKNDSDEELRTLATCSPCGACGTENVQLQHVDGCLPPLSAAVQEQEEPARQRRHNQKDKGHRRENRHVVVHEQEKGLPIRKDVPQRESASHQDADPKHPHAVRQRLVHHVFVSQICGTDETRWNAHRAQLDEFEAIDLGLEHESRSGHDEHPAHHRRLRGVDPVPSPRQDRSKNSCTAHHGYRREAPS